MMFADTVSGVAIPSGNSLRDVTWSTCTCPLTWEAQGVHREGIITAVAKSTNIIAAGDDSGRISIFNFPVVEDDAPPSMCYGHSGCVRRIVWASDARLMLSCGGADNSVIQWS